jgi:hypothetical protein
VESYPLEELKLVYRVLHRHLSQHTELLDSRFFEDLQRYLHRKAQAEGVDIGDHGAWDIWLGNAPVSCATRVEKRSVLN